MKGAIAGMGLMLSAAILATSASAAQHPNGAVSASAITQRAVNEFVESYASRDSVGLAHTTTSDFEAQYRLAQSGTSVTVDEDALISSWQEAGDAPPTHGQHWKVIIFPSADATAVFVTYRIPGDAGSDRIALLELRGNRVARIHDLAGPVPHFIEFASMADSRQVAAAEHPAQ
jgi:hypothetical protein